MTDPGRQFDPPGENPRIVFGLEQVPRSLRGGVLSIGNFDGVHRGHQKIIATARRLADPEQLPVVAMTFDPPPDLVLRPADPPRRLGTTDQKARWLIEAGADGVVVAVATGDLLALPPEQFVTDVIADRFAPRHIVEGPNFYFGRRREGDVSLLDRLGGRLGFACHVVQPLTFDEAGTERRISSTRIRQLLAAGDVRAAAEALGRPYRLCGPVVHGDGVGRQLSFPTVNVDPGQQAVPADGVYAGLAETPAGRFVAAISVGTKPTFGRHPRTVEAHLLDAQADLYHEQVDVLFVHYLRPQQTYASGEALRQQIERDVADVRRLCC